MKYYLLREAEGIKQPDIQDYNTVVNYQAFKEDKSYNMSSRMVFIVNNEPDFGLVLFSPYPLIRMDLKESLDRFAWDINYKEVIFLSKDRTESYDYLLPFFRRISADCSLVTCPDGSRITVISAADPIPEDIPIVYLQTGEEFLLMVRLDLAESLLRKGLFGIQMIAVDFQTIGGILHE